MAATKASSKAALDMIQKAINSLMDLSNDPVIKRAVSDGYVTAANITSAITSLQGEMSSARSTHLGITTS